ncbi:MAG: regulatory iron-sulfur-containing complex subunit RicT [Alistipes finegoldii]
MDFRELIKVFAERFHIRIEMKQIGARQEADASVDWVPADASCAAHRGCRVFERHDRRRPRTGNFAQPQKLAGQCSKLKCCMMYEYDTYVDARKEFPRLREPLRPWTANTIWSRTTFWPAR